MITLTTFAICPSQLFWRRHHFCEKGVKWQLLFAVSFFRRRTFCAAEISAGKQKITGGNWVPTQCGSQNRQPRPVAFARSRRSGTITNQLSNPDGAQLRRQLPSRLADTLI